MTGTPERERFKFTPREAAWRDGTPFFKKETQHAKLVF